MDLSLVNTAMLERVVGFAERLSANLQLLHVVEKNQTKVDAKEFLEEILLKNEISSEKLHIKEGDVQESILKLATDTKVDLIIIGSHGRKGVSPLGSTAKGVLSAIKCDILTLSVTNYEKGT